MLTPPQPLRRSLPTLPFHLTLQGMLWWSCNAALLQARLGSASLKQSWQSFTDVWPMMPQPLLPDHEALETAVKTELAQRTQKLVNGVRAYTTHSYARPESEACVIWQSGATRILDYGAPEHVKATLLFVPSLINRYYVLDLLPKRSLIKFLKNQGYHALVIDWGSPTVSEYGFSGSDYVIQRLLPAIEIVRQATGDTPLMLAGYCMGGLFSLAAAQFTHTKLAGLILMATPWDFHTSDFPRVKLNEERIKHLEAKLAVGPTVPGAMIQMLFYAANPWLFAKKFAQFGEGEMSEEEAMEFVAMESWVNDNVDMTAPVARECLIDWVQHNHPALGEWKIAGHPVQPDGLTLPVFVACPRHDTVVPPRSAEALLRVLPQSSICRPASGHVGMVAGSNAHTELWQPLDAWIQAIVSP